MPTTPTSRESSEQRCRDYLPSLISGRCVRCEMNGEQHPNNAATAGSPPPTSVEPVPSNGSAEQSGAPGPVVVAPSSKEKPQQGRIPDLEATRHNAEYWLNAAREVEDRDEAVLAIEQVANAWKNAAYAMADQRDALRSAIGALSVPRELVQQVVVLLQSYAEYGMQHVYEESGERTPNAILSDEIASKFSTLLADSATADNRSANER